MVDMLLAHVFYSKVVDDEDKDYGSGVVVPECMCVVDGTISVGGNALDE
jgi:hypothetical protein